MRPYSFLLEAIGANQQQAPVNPLMQRQTEMGFSSLFKPLNISGLTLKTRNVIMKEGQIKLGRINRLTAKLQKDATNPENKNQQEAQIKLKYAQDAYKLHHEFISKTIFWKSRTGVNMGPQFLQLKEQYTRALFTLEQAYKRTALKLNPANTDNY